MIKGTDNFPIGTLISQRVPFYVPLYQRAYAWEGDDVNDFLSDVTALYSNLQNGVSRLHFFGGVVSVEQSIQNTASGTSYEVVDGQQRLATFMLSFSVIAELFRSLANEATAAGNSAEAKKATDYSDHTENQYIYYMELDAQGSKKELRLTLSRADQLFFRSLITRTNPAPSRESHKRLTEARDTIQAHLEALIRDGTPDVAIMIERLRMFRVALTECCHVIHVRSDNKSEAYRLFSVLNDRGRTLSEGDLLRSRTFELLQNHPNSQSEIEGPWEEILSKKDAEVLRFLRAYYPSRVAKRAPVHDLFDSYSEQFLNLSSIGNSEAQTIVNFVRELHEEFELFQDLSAGDWPFESPSAGLWDRSRLQTLIRVLRHDLCLPLLLASARNHTEKEFAELISLIERFSFRHIFIVGNHPTKSAEQYYRHSKRIRDGNYSFNDFRSDLANLVTNDSPNDLFISNLFAVLNYSASKQRRNIRYFFCSMEDYREWIQKGARGAPATSKVITFDVNATTIEHIYPQNPGTKDLQLEPVKHELANLAIWGPNDNRAAGNTLFPRKKTKYAASEIRYLNDLSELRHWTISEYDSQKDKLKKWAAAVFQI